MGSLRIVFFFSKTKVKSVQKSYHSFSENDINYKPSMKNFQRFHVIRFLQKQNNWSNYPLPPGGVLPHLAAREERLCLGGYWGEVFPHTLCLRKKM